MRAQFVAQMESLQHRLSLGKDGRVVRVGANEAQDVVKPADRTRARQARACEPAKEFKAPRSRCRPELEAPAFQLGERTLRHGRDRNTENDEAPNPAR
jgi:hypothetical protein